MPTSSARVPAARHRPPLPPLHFQEWWFIADPLYKHQGRDKFKQGEICVLPRERDVQADPKKGILISRGDEKQKLGLLHFF